MTERKSFYFSIREIYRYIYQTCLLLNAYTYHTCIYYVCNAKSTITEADVTSMTEILDDEAITRFNFQSSSTSARHVAFRFQTAFNNPTPTFGLPVAPIVTFRIYRLVEETVDGEKGTTEARTRYGERSEAI